MKTTVEIPDSLLKRLRRQAADQGVTLKEILTQAVRQFLATSKPERPFKLEDGSFRGEGLAEGVRSWEDLIDLSYEGRGT